MIRLVCILAVVAACTRSAEIGKSAYAKVLDTMEDPPSKLDVVFVIDDSASITDDQGALVEAARTELFPQLRTMSGELPDLHLAIVSSSLHVLGIGGCSSGPNGQFVIGPQWDEGAPCTAVSGTYLTDQPDGSGGRTTNYTGTLDDAFACMATIGDRGCGVEQPLEALRRALQDPSSDGFLRDDAMLLVVFLTDEDDSSGTDPMMWPENDPYDLNNRWFEYGVVCDQDPTTTGPHTGCVPDDASTALSPIGSYVDYLQSLKSDPGLVMVAGIVSPSGPVDVEPDDGGKLLLAPACSPPGRGGVQPAIRLNAFMPEFPARYVLTSFCDSSMAERVHRIASSVTGVMTNRPCLLTDKPVSPRDCRAFDIDENGNRTATTAKIVEDPEMCGYTPSHLRADVDVAAGHHLEIDCLQ
jgi:hypothetical protein